MTITQIIVLLSSFCLLSVIIIWFLIGSYLIRRDEVADEYRTLLKDPRVRSIILQLIRNQYYDKPKNAFEKRSNNKRALAVIRLRRLVKDPNVRKKIYNLVDDRNYK